MQRKFELPVPPALIVTVLGALSTILILYRIIHHPTASASFGGFHASAGIKIGIWLGLIASAAITYGGYLAMQAAPGPARASAEQPGGEAFSGLAGGPASTSPGPAPEAAAAGAPPLPPPQAPPTPPAPQAPPAGDPPPAPSGG
jgi:hypothetical protein